jgi:Na+/H+ antiporter NhaC
MMNRLRRLIASLLVVSLAGMGVPLPAQAGIVATEDVLALSNDRARIGDVVERADVQARLQAYGVSPAEVKARVAALTDAEAADLAARVDSLPAGAESVLGVILIVFLVLLFTDIMGWTKIFPFTRPVK